MVISKELTSDSWATMSSNFSPAMSSLLMWSLRSNFMLGSNSETSFSKTLRWMRLSSLKISEMSTKRQTCALSTKSSLWGIYLSWLTLTSLNFPNFLSKLRLALQLWMARDKSVWSHSSCRFQPTKKSWGSRLTSIFSVWMLFNSLAKWLVRVITSVHRHSLRCSTTTWIVMLTRWLNNSKVKWAPSLKTLILLTRCFISK